MHTYPVKILTFFISNKHNYFGQKDNIPASNPTLTPASIELVAHKGIAGDRFFDIKADYDGHVTFINAEVVEDINRHHDSEVKAEYFRRNVLIEGVSVVELIGKKFTINGIEFEGIKHCAPCRWMDIKMGKGVMKLLKGRGGLRARILSNGVLKKGEAELLVEIPLKMDVLDSLPRPRIPSEIS